MIGTEQNLVHVQLLFRRLDGLLTRTEAANKMGNSTLITLFRNLTIR
ncbi:hypothetical protein ABES58_13705 [Paenibacillus lautus]